MTEKKTPEEHLETSSTYDGFIDDLFKENPKANIMCPLCRNDIEISAVGTEPVEEMNCPACNGKISVGALYVPCRNIHEVAMTMKQLIGLCNIFTMGTDKLKEVIDHLMFQNKKEEEDFYKKAAEAEKTYHGLGKAGKEAVDAFKHYLEARRINRELDEEGIWDSREEPEIPPGIDIEDTPERRAIRRARMNSPLNEDDDWPDEII